MLDTGNFVTGSGNGLTFKADAVLQTMKELGYNAVGVGKHDIRRLGAHRLVSLFDAAELPMITSNLIVKNSGKPFSAPYFLTDMDGLSVAVFSVLPLGIFGKSPGLESTFEIIDQDKILRKWLAELNGRADVTILLADLNREAITALLSDLPIDIVISNGDFLVAESSSDDLQGTQLLSSGCRNGVSLQMATVRVNDTDGHVTVTNNRTIDLGESVPEDDIINEIIRNSLKRHGGNSSETEEMDEHQLFEKYQDLLKMSPSEYINQMNEKTKTGEDPA